MRIVISQPMYFPWVGMLEQIQIADVFVFYNDVQFTRGFFHRVQIKTAHGTKWMTVPLRDQHRGQLINQIAVDNRQNWRRKHRDVLAGVYREAPHCEEMLAVVDRVFARPTASLSELARTSMIELARYFGLVAGRQFVASEALAVPGGGSERLCEIVKTLGGDEYITGHGARHYLHHELFAAAGIAVKYMRYECRPYSQLHGPFTPYVTALDLIANCGRNGAQHISSGTQSVREFAEAL